MSETNGDERNDCFDFYALCRKGRSGILKTLICPADVLDISQVTADSGTVTVVKAGITRAHTFDGTPFSQVVSELGERRRKLAALMLSDHLATGGLERVVTAACEAALQRVGEISKAAVKAGKGELEDLIDTRLGAMMDRLAGKEESGKTTAKGAKKPAE